MNPEVADFFGAIGPYYGARTDLATVEAALGRSPSGPTRMAFYQRLLAANRRRILRHVFPTLHAVVGAPERAGLPPLGSWDGLVARYAQAHPATGFDPNALGLDFAAWLANEDLPAGLAELADWSWRLLASARAPQRTDEVLDPSVSAAQYPFDVASWQAGFIAGHAPVGLARAAAEGPTCVLLVYREPSALRVRVLRPSPDELLVLARAAGESPPGCFDEAALARASRRLVHLGILYEGTPPCA